MWSVWNDTQVLEDNSPSPSDRKDLSKEDFTKEDVEHIDDAICEVIEESSTKSLPGLEWIRNKLAARVGVPLRASGGITWEARREKGATWAVAVVEPEACEAPVIGG